MGVENFGPLKAATKKFASKVREMRHWQQSYFKAPKDSQEKASALAMARKLEREVDETLSKINQVIDQL